MTASNVIRIVQATLIAIGLAFGISVVVAGHWWSDKPKLDLDNLGQQVTSSLQNQFDTGDTKNLGLHVGKDIFLINVNGNEYRGMVTVRTAKLTAVPVAVTVYADDIGHMMWQLDPASSARLTTTAEKDKDPTPQQTCWGPQC
jgi:hypothetical protein